MRLPCLFLLLLLAGCGARDPASESRVATPEVVDGWDSYGRTTLPIACGIRPVLLTGSHTDLRLTGPCGHVRVAGDHNDVELQVAQGGTVEITGEHNDVFWQPLGNPALRPTLLDRGTSNTFHRRTGDE